MSEFREILDRIERERDMPSRTESFARFRAAFREAGYSYDRSRVILVAGTNGKGSVAKGLEVLLASTGYKVGLFTSPHLIRTTERVRSDGTDLTEAEFVRAFRFIEPLVVKHSLSHFETLTLLAAEVFFCGRVRPVADWTILEVGVGGLFDPTNAVDHATTVIAKLGCDHRELLGGTLSSIAAHKLGAVPLDGLVVHMPFPAEVVAEVELARQSKGGRWVESRAFGLCRDLSGPEPKYSLETRWGEVHTDLPGPRAAENLALAVHTFESLGFDPSAHVGALSNVAWPGRMETFRLAGLPCPVHLSGDHNVQGVESLLAFLPDYPRSRLHWLIGIGERKDRDAMLTLFSSVANSELNLTCVPFRGTSLDAYGSWLNRAVDHDENPLSCFQRILSRANASDRIVVSGSLYLVGAIRAALSRTVYEAPGEQRKPIK